MRLGVIDRFTESHSFDSANLSASCLTKLKPFSEEELTRIVKGSIDNNQVYSAFTARDVVRKLIHEQPGLVDNKLTRRYEALVQENW